MNHNSVSINKPGLGDTSEHESPNKQGFKTQTQNGTHSVSRCYCWVMGAWRGHPCKLADNSNTKTYLNVFQN